MLLYALVIHVLTLQAVYTQIQKKDPSKFLITFCQFFSLKHIFYLNWKLAPKLLKMFDLGQSESYGFVLRLRQKKRVY